MTVTFFAPSDWFADLDPTLTGVSWNAGDEIIVLGITGLGTQTLSTPTATGLTFSLVSASPSVDAGDPYVALWRARATADGSSVTISSTRVGGTDPAALAAWVHRGPADVASTLAGNNTESAYSAVSVPAGATVLYALSDWNATTPTVTPLTGSGTATERADTGDATNYGVYACDWQNTAAGSFTFGPSSYAGMIIAQAGVVLAPLKAYGKYAVSAGDTAAQTQVASSTAYKAGTQLLVLGSAIRTGHSNGLGAGWALPVDNATTNDPTWTQVGLSTINDGLGAGFEVQTAAWISTVLTADESFTITIDAHSGGASTFNYAMEVIELLEGPWSITQAVNGFSSTGSATATFSPAPTPGLEILSGWGLGTGSPATLTWAAPPTGFTAIPGAETPIVGEVEMNAAVSTGNTTAGLTWSYTGGTPLATNLLALEFDLGAATVEQKSFRWGTDDAAESAHGWAAAQDANLTAPVTDPKLLRFLLQAAGGDPAATAWKLRHQVNGSGGYADTPVGATITPTLAFGAAGTWAYSTGDPTPSYPSGITALSELILVTTNKPSTANTATTPTITGWTLIGSITGANDGDTGGYGATLGADTGNMNLWVFQKDTVTGSESGTVTVDHSGHNHAGAGIYRFEKSEAGAISVAMVTGKDTSAGNVSIVTGSVALAPGDQILAGMAIPTDVTTPAQFSSEALAATGITFGTVTERTEMDTTSGSDSGGFIVSSEVTAGTATQAVTLTATAGGTTTNVRGPGFVLRLRPEAAYSPSVYIAPSANIAAGGEATTQRLTGGSGSFTAGRRWDNENGTDTIDIGSDGNTELEWLVGLQGLADGDYVDFRLTPIDTYTATPRWTVGSGSPTGTGSMVYGGSVAATGTPTRLGTGTGSYGGSITATGTPTRLGTGTGSYGGSVTAAGTAQRLGTGSLDYGGTVAATGTIPPVEGTGSLDYGGSVSGSGTPTRLGTGTLAYGGSVAATGVTRGAVTGVVTLAYGGSVAGTGQAARLGTGSLDYGGSVAATGQAALSGTAALAYGGSVAATGQVQHLGTGTLGYGGSVAATGSRTGSGTGAGSYGGTVTATGQVTRLGTGTLAYGGTVTGTGTIPTGAVLGTGAAVYGGSVAATGAPVRIGSAVASYGGAVAGAGTAVRVGAVSVGYGGTVAATGQPVRFGVVTLAYGGTVAGAGQRQRLGTVVAAYGGTLTGFGFDPSAPRAPLPPAAGRLRLTSRAGGFTVRGRGLWTVSRTTGMGRRR
jgi:fibronectin-binding autotransporter adhesin